MKLKIPIIFGWLVFHREMQLCFSKRPLLVIHWNRASWSKGDLYSKRLLVLGATEDKQDTLDFHDAWFKRE